MHHIIENQCLTVSAASQSTLHSHPSPLYSVRFPPYLEDILHMDSKERAAHRPIPYKGLRSVVRDTVRPRVLCVGNQPATFQRRLQKITTASELPLLAIIGSIELMNINIK